MAKVYQKSTVAVIGAGFAGLSAATHLAQAGKKVIVFEKNSSPGGRARKFSSSGFTFDMGPSWYWMPDVFESYFQKFGKRVDQYYSLQRLDPAYRVYFGKNDFLDVPADMKELYQIFESLEPGSSKKLSKFLADARYKYEVGINDLVYRPGRSVSEYYDLRLLRGLLRMNVLKSISKEIRQLFSHPRIIQWLEFPVLFLGAKPSKTPALYSLMNYADLVLGTWYPDGGMSKIGEAMFKLAKEMGVEFRFNSPVKQILTEKDKVTGIQIQDETIPIDACIGAADYHHLEKNVIPQEKRQYSDKYWAKRTMAPSSLIFYLGVNKKLSQLKHHNLFFDSSFDQHAAEIYDDPKWPENPLFYICCTSKTDDTVAPEGMENVFILIPVAPGLNDSEEIRERYYEMIMDRIFELTGEKIAPHVIYKRSFAHKDFISEYNSFKGNAYGLANTLKQTAVLKPNMKHKKLNNMYFAGQLTVPGPGVPPSIISGNVAANELLKDIG